MPYIITTTTATVTTTSIAGTQEWDAATGEPAKVSRRAVATLDEVHHTQLMALEPGKPVTLPDGTVIEVEPTEYDALFRAAGRVARAADGTEGILAAYNDAQKITERLEYLRGELRAERISYGGLAELADLAKHIEPGDVELLEAAGVPEFE